MLLQPVRLLYLWRPGSSHGGAARVALMVGWLRQCGVVVHCYLDEHIACIIQPASVGKRRGVCAWKEVYAGIAQVLYGMG